MGIKKGVGNILTGKNFGLGSAFFAGLNVVSTVGDYKNARLEGRSKVGAAASAVGGAIMFEAMGMAGLGLQMAGAIPSIGMNTYLKANSMARSMDRASRNVPFANQTFVDTQQTYTMRQAGMQMAQASKYNLQQTLMGNEASVMHRL